MNNTKMILVRAIRVHNYNNGLVGIEVPAHTMSDADHEKLREFFPRLVERAYELLDAESLLAAMHIGPLPGMDTIHCQPQTKATKRVPMHETDLT